jgi:hypothetical protein
MTPELARRIADTIAESARVVLEQRNIRDGAGDIAREIGRNAARMVVFLIEAVGGNDLLCVTCGAECGKTTNDMCEACHRREITREKDEERAR